MNFDIVLGYIKSNPIIWTIIIVISLVFLVMLVAGIAIFYLWIKHSWIRRNNSKNFTGEDVSRKILDKGGLKNTKIFSSFLYVKYWNFNKRKNTYRLRPWTHNRRSVWTMMEASQQAWVATLRGANKKQYWMIFRLPIVFKIIGAIVGIVTSAMAYSLINKSGGWDGLQGNKSKQILFWLDLSIGFSVGAILFMVAEVGKIYLIRKNVVPYIEKMGLNQEELKTIKRIYNWRMVYAVAQAILEIIKLLLRIAARLNEANKK